MPHLPALTERRPRAGARRTRPVMLATAAALVAMVAAGGSASAATGAGLTSSSGTAGLKPYRGPESSAFKLLPRPARDSAVHFKLGYLDPFAAIPGLLDEQNAACAEAKALGGSCVTDDANDEVQTQVAQFSQLLAQKVTAIVVSPLDPQALAPSLKQAAAAHVPVVVNDAPADLSTAAVSGAASNISQAFDYSSWATMTAIARLMPGTTFAIMASSSPNPLLQYLVAREKSWGVTQGLKFVGQVAAPSDSQASWASTAGTIAQRYPSARVLVTYNDPSAVAAASGLASVGKSDIKVADANGFESLAATAIKDGKMIASYSVPTASEGTQMAIAAYDKLAGRPVPTTIAIKSVAVTKANVASVKAVG
jgi:ABC-type sugar transport system substrate-binding protein